MTAPKPRFEIVRDDSGHWARYVAANGKSVFVTETYSRKRGAENAIESITGSFITHHAGWSEVRHGRFGEVVEVRYLDSRLKKTSRPELRLS